MCVSLQATTTNWLLMCSCLCRWAVPKDCSLFINHVSRKTTVRSRSKVALFPRVSTTLLSCSSFVVPQWKLAVVEPINLRCDRIRLTRALMERFCFRAMQLIPHQFNSTSFSRISVYLESRSDFFFSLGVFRSGLTAPFQVVYEPLALVRRSRFLRRLHPRQGSLKSSFC